jgi:hypothetical protein
MLCRGVEREEIRQALFLAPRFFIVQQAEPKNRITAAVAKVINPIVSFHLICNFASRGFSLQKERS